jgi:excisionase family DNA binding protein
VLESSLIEFEENLQGESQVRPLERKGLELLSIPEVCQELGMGKSWVYRRIQSGEIPSVKLGRNIKVRREDLEGYLEDQRYQPTASEG